MTEVAMATVVRMLPREVVKRGGQRVDFDAGKIRSALLRPEQRSGRGRRGMTSFQNYRLLEICIRNIHIEAYKFFSYKDGYIHVLLY